MKSNFLRRLVVVVMFIPTFSASFVLAILFPLSYLFTGRGLEWSDRCDSWLYKMAFPKSVPKKITKEDICDPHLFDDIKEEAERVLSKFNQYLVESQTQFILLHCKSDEERQKMIAEYTVAFIEGKSGSWMEKFKESCQEKS